MSHCARYSAEEVDRIESNDVNCREALDKAVRKVGDNDNKSIVCPAVRLVQDEAWEIVSGFNAGYEVFAGIDPDMKDDFKVMIEIILRAGIELGKAGVELYEHEGHDHATPDKAGAN